MSSATMTNDQVQTPVLIHGGDVLRLTGWDPKTFKRFCDDGKFPAPLFTRGGWRWWNRMAVLKALGLEAAPNTVAATGTE